LWLRQHGADAWRERVARVLAASVFVLGALTLVQYVLGTDLGLDRLVFPYAADVIYPGRPSPQTAVAMVLTGGALMLLDTQWRGFRPAEALALVTGLLGVAVLLGHLYGAVLLYGITPGVGMAVHTAIGFIVLSVGTLCARPDRGGMAIVSSDTYGGLLARWLGAAAVAVPVVSAFLRLLGQQRGVFDELTGGALSMAFNMAVALAIVLWMASALHRADMKQRAGDQRLRESEQHFRSVARTAGEAIVSAGSAGTIVFFNEAAERLFGRTAAAAVGQPLTMLMPARYREAHLAGFSRWLATRENRVVGKTVELAGLRNDGEFPLELSIAAWDANEGWFFTAIMRDVSERKRHNHEIVTLNQTLQARAAQLEVANKELEMFSYSVSHDLRAPLRHIDGFIDLLRKRSGGALDAQGTRYMDTISGSAKRMGQLIDDLIAFSRVSRSQMKRVRVDLRALVQETIEEMRSETANRAIRWTVADLPEVEGDPGLLKLVFFNLLGNALKFTRTRAEATIELLAEPGGEGRVAIEVRDNGVGFDMQYGDKLFGVFQRLHGQAEFEGTGIGLASVQRIIQRHGGKISARAEIDKGAAFTFTLPLANFEERQDE
jgi:PAS domain S-box-containing protein